VGCYLRCSLFYGFSLVLLCVNSLAAEGCGLRQRGGISRQRRRILREPAGFRGNDMGFCGMTEDFAAMEQDFAAGFQRLRRTHGILRKAKRLCFRKLSPTR